MGINWHSAGTEEPGDQNGDTSVRHGYWSIGPDGNEWSIVLVALDDDNGEDWAEEVRLPNEPTETAAKVAAQTYEESHRPV